MPGAPRQGRDLSFPRVVLVATPDDYLLELQRHDLETTWREEFPDGECVILDPTPPVPALVQELVNPSLFATARLVVVPDATALVEASGKETNSETLTEALRALAFDGVSLLLAAATGGKPGGELAEVVVERGELRWLPLPEQPKPWDDFLLTPAQRGVLRDLLGRQVPAVLEHDDVVEALLQAHGFRPRELVQAAEGLLASGEMTAEAVRRRAGPGEIELRALEDILIARDEAAAARLFAVLSVGGPLVGFRGEVIEGDRRAGTLVSFLGRVLRQALAVRALARTAGAEKELDGKKTSGKWWYPRTFKSGVYPKLHEAAVEAAPNPIESLSAWQLHRVFKVAAGFSDESLLDALAALARSGAERDRGGAGLAAVAVVVISLIRGDDG